MGSKSKALTSGTGTPEGWLGERRSSYTPEGWLGERRRSYTQQAMVRGPEGTGETLWETVVGGARRNGRERGQDFPCPLRRWGTCWAPGPNPLPSEPPSCCAEPKPRPYTPTQGPTSTLREPLQRSGPKPHPHALTQGPTSNSRTPPSRGPPFHVLPLPSAQVLSKGPAPCLNVTTPPT